MIYVCIPAHNEERTVGVLLWKIRQVLSDFPRDYQLLVANDASTDSTADVLLPYQRVLPLTVLNTQQKRGYATALELLLREAVRRSDYPKRDVIVTMQADFTDDPDVLAALLKRVEAGADVVCANAELPQNAPRAQRWSRQLGNFLLRGRGWPEGVTDPLSGYRAYRVLVVKRALEERNGGRLLTWDGWPASAELLKLVQPHSRRTECISTVQRIDRQQRATRRGFWETLPGLLGFARGATGPLTATAIETADTTVDPRGRRHGRGQRPRDREDRPARGTGLAEDPHARRRRDEEGGPPERAERRERAGRRDRSEPRARSEATDRAKAQSRSEPRQRPEGREQTEPAREPRPRRKRPPATPEGNGQTPELLESAEGVVPAVAAAENGQPVPAPRKKRRRRRRRPGAAEASTASAGTEPSDAVTEAASAEVLSEGAVNEGVVPGDGARRRRNRRGRGRRGRRSNAPNAQTTENDASESVQARPDPQPAPPVVENGASGFEA